MGDRHDPLDTAAPGGFLRAPHGNALTHGAPGPRVEVHAPDELPAAIPVTPPDRTALADRQSGGRFTPRSAAVAGAMGGRLAKGRPSLVSSLGLSQEFAPSAEAFLPYRRKAASFRQAHCRELAELAGGQCGTGPSSMVASAALQLAASRYLYDLATHGGGQPDLKVIKEARQQADSSRQNLLAAYELAIREGRARGVGGTGRPDIDEITKRAEEEADQRRVARRGRSPIDVHGEAAE